MLSVCESGNAIVEVDHVAEIKKADAIKRRIAIYDKYKSGVSAIALAAEYKITRARIYQILAKGKDGDK